MIKLIIYGVAGRMGMEILKMVNESDDIEVIAGIEASGHKSVGMRVGDIKITDRIEPVIEKGDCVVDFTNPQATLENLDKAKVFKKPYVTGTTGFSDKEIKTINEMSKIFPLFLAPNMSIGINHLYNLVQFSVDKLSNFDIEVVETHHRAKKDAPSGTANALAKIIKDSRPDVNFTYGREGLVGTRTRNEVCINSIRGGDIVGEHRILFLGDGEFIELRHYATSRRCFAAGTLEAVKFIVDKGPGLYSMQDMLKVK